MGDQSERERSLADIRDTYRAYGREGRTALWDLSNPGHRRLTQGRDDRLTSLLRASLPAAGTGTLVDVGCGTGGVATLIADQSLLFTVTGIDLLPDRIAVARVRVPDATFVAGSADAMPFGDESFDVACAITLFSSLPTPALERSVAGEIARVLRPGGWLIWYDLRYRNPWNARVHGIGARRLAALFPAWPAELDAIGVPPPIARRLGRLAPLAYPALHAFRPFRSHLVGRLRKPA
jgi:ubiquinone/menaquinone biosynthesis C-methylase UbiE